MPPKVLFVLLSIKSRLASKIAEKGSTIEGTSTSPQSVIVTLSDPPKMRKEHKSTVRMRHAKSGGAFQRSCQRKDWSSPVY